MKQMLLKLWDIMPLSYDAQLFIMRRFNSQFLVGVTGIILNDNDEILLFKHSYRDKDQWMLPGGYIKSKEHPKEALEREIKEESGLIISADERIRIRTDRESARLDIIYKGKYMGGQFNPSDEIVEAGFFHFDKLPRLKKDQLVFVDKALNNSEDIHN